MRVVPTQGIWTRKDPENTILTLDEMKSFCYIDSVITDDDALLTRMELAARNICEQFLGRPLLTASQVLYYSYSDINHLLADSPSPKLLLPSGKLQSIDSVSIWDVDGDETVLDAVSYYELSTVGEQGQIYFKQSPFSSGIASRELDALQVAITGGFGDITSTVPNELKLGMELMISYWYEHRGDQTKANTITSSAKAVWSPWKMQRFKV